MPEPQVLSDELLRTARANISEHRIDSLGIRGFNVSSGLPKLAWARDADFWELSGDQDFGERFTLFQHQRLEAVVLLALALMEDPSSSRKLGLYAVVAGGEAFQGANIEEIFDDVDEDLKEDIETSTELGYPSPMMDRVGILHECLRLALSNHGRLQLRAAAEMCET